MPSKPLKPCSTIRCPNLTKERYCDEHKFDKNERSKQYDRFQRDRRSKAFYNSPEWKNTRNAAFMRDHGLCQYCLKNGTIKAADVVHHKEEIKKAWDKRLDLENLVSICHACHNKEHG